MKIYAAPMEGITGYPFRNLQKEMFDGIDKYFIPFISVHERIALSTREKKEIAPENNRTCIIPQLLGNNANDTVSYIKYIADMGYKEINLNFGCPSGTVTGKKKGAGILADPDFLDEFLEKLFDGLRGFDIDISIKTRTGMYENDDPFKLIEIYNRYPISELTVHPRFGKQKYKGRPDMEAFGAFYRESHIPLIYNGDIWTKDDAERIALEFPLIKGIMVGRGLVANPALAREIRGGDVFSNEEIKAFLDRLYEGWTSDIGNKKIAMLRMKEIWDYMRFSFPDREKEIHKLKKAKDTFEYEIAVREILRG
ncbi:MAG: tRNA-dihydrouridine synthase family protein [Catonella sp.]|jgi:tRNA-dihydrouridine synthase|nr:tRNA-dihydrouridine synthase family protein [Catonella sp.]MDY6356324.1 tRNA-dihydrouridine synthase family protein [Catonella sp.]